MCNTSRYISYLIWTLNTVSIFFLISFYFHFIYKTIERYRLAGLMASGLFHYYIIFQYLLGFTMNIIYILVLELFLFFMLIWINARILIKIKCHWFFFIFEKKTYFYKTNRVYSAWPPSRYQLFSIFFHSWNLIGWKL